MDWWLLLTVLTAALVGLMLTGLPVAFSFLLVTSATMFWLMGGDLGLNQLVLSIYDSLTKFNLTPIPFFVLMGEVLYHSGLASRTLDVFSKWMGAIPGRLSIITLLAGGLFASLSGSTVANTAMFGSLMVPEMRQRGYSTQMTVGPIMGSGALAMVIPPSALAVLLGSLAEVSIGGLLIAVIVPGILLLTLFLIYTVTRCYLDPSLAPSYEVERVAATEKVWVALRDVVPLTFIVFLVIGLIFLGVATPTEAAALGALGSIVLAAVYRGISLDVMRKSTLGSLKVTVMILTIIAGSVAFSQILAFSGASRELVQAVMSTNLSPLAVILVMLGIILVMGCFMEQVSIMMITVPIYMPIVGGLGVDPIWFCVLMLICLEIGQLTPPFGLALFVMKGVMPKDVPMAEIYKGALPFVLCNLVAVALLMAFPVLTTWLPSFL
ncbi:MAG: TRAP transporter large permease [Thermoleophilia bacterium]